MRRRTVCYTATVCHWTLRRKLTSISCAADRPARRATSCPSCCRPTYSKDGCSNKPRNAVGTVTSLASKLCVMLCVDDTLAYTTGSGDVIQLNVKTNETSVVVDNATLVSMLTSRFDFIVNVQRSARQGSALLETIWYYCTISSIILLYFTAILQRKYIRNSYVSLFGYCETIIRRSFVSCVNFPLETGVYRLPRKWISFWNGVFWCIHSDIEPTFDSLCRSRGILWLEVEHMYPIGLRSFSTLLSVLIDVRRREMPLSWLTVKIKINWAWFNRT